MAWDERVPARLRGPRPSVRDIAAALTPPVLTALAQRIRGRLRPDGDEWVYLPEGWARARAPEVRGWDVADVAAAYARIWPSIVAATRGPGPLGLAYEVATGADVATDDPEAHNTVISYAYALAFAARHRRALSILDWGGGAGQYRLITGAALPDLALDYHVRDMPALCRFGRAVLPDVTFHEDDTCLDRTYELVLASGSLQYSEDWQEMLGRLRHAAERFVFVSRLPIARRGGSFVVLQRAQAYGYNTEYVGWVIKRQDFLTEAARLGLRLVREFALAEGFSARGAPEPVRYAGFLFAVARPE